MAQDNLALACDQLSHKVDAVLFERLRWARTEAPMLVRLVELAQAVLTDRGDFELTEESSTVANKRYVLKVHGQRIFAINLSLSTAHDAMVTPEAIERSKYRLTSTEPVHAPFADVDEAWMAHAIATVCSRIEG